MENLDSKEPENNRVDKFGIVASSLCALHCAVCAFLPAIFGIIGLDLLSTQESEWAFTFIAIAFATGALMWSRRGHRSNMVAGTLAAGIIFLLASRFLEMGSDHHHDHSTEHHTESHHDEKNDKESNHHDEHHNDKPHEEDHHKDSSKEKHHPESADHHDDHNDEDSEASHVFGATVGILGGILLLFGHILNIRTSTRFRK